MYFYNSKAEAKKHIYKDSDDIPTLRDEIHVSTKYVSFYKTEAGKEKIIFYNDYKLDNLKEKAHAIAKKKRNPYWSRNFNSEENEILNVYCSYLIITKNYKEFSSLLKEFNNYIYIHRWRSSTEPEIDINYIKANLLFTECLSEENTNLCTGYGGDVDDIARCLEALDAAELKELLEDTTMKKLIEKFSSRKKFKNSYKYSNQNNNMLLSLDCLEQNYDLIESTINAIIPKGFESSYYWRKPSKNDWDVRRLIKMINGDYDKFILILRQYINTNFGIGRKYSELELKLKQIKTILEILEVNYTIADVIEGLPVKVYSRAIGALM